MFILPLFLLKFEGASTDLLPSVPCVLLSLLCLTHIVSLLPSPFLAHPYSVFNSNPLISFPMCVCKTVSPDKCFSVNPCGVGHSINQLYSQNYTCVCPVGYKVGNLAVTKNATCVPGQQTLTFAICGLVGRIPLTVFSPISFSFFHLTGYSYPQTWTVATYVDMVCRDLYEPLDMDKKTFIQKNPVSLHPFI